MKCKYCGKEVELPYQCNFCQNYFCMEHRLPENHACVEAPPRTPLGSWQTRKEMKRIRAEKEAQSDKFASEGDFHFIKKELPMFTLSKNKKKKSKFSFLRRKKEE